MFRFVATLSVAALLMACQQESMLDTAWNECEAGSEKKITAVYDYADFGPPSMSGEMLGPEYWTWQNQGGGDPSKEFDVKVVVHADNAKKLAMTHYVVDPVKEADYRYVSFMEATSFLDFNILELKELASVDGETSFPKLTAALTNLKARIQKEVCP